MRIMIAILMVCNISITYVLYATQSKLKIQRENTKLAIGVSEEWKGAANECLDSYTKGTQGYGECVEGYKGCMVDLEKAITRSGQFLTGTGR
jgi:hypothetical protein